MQSTVTAKGYEKNAWILVAILGLAGIAFSLPLILGIQIDVSLPALTSTQTYLARVAGMSLLGFAFFGLIIAYTAFRKGEKWAWYLTWYLPIYLFYSTADNYVQGGGNWPLYFVFLVISLAGLLLPYRMFFSKK